MHIYNGILLSYKKRWNTDIGNNMDGSWNYHAKQNKTDKWNREPYDFNHIGNIKTEYSKQTGQTNKNS